MGLPDVTFQRFIYCFYTYIYLIDRPVFSPIQKSVRIQIFIKTKQTNVNKNVETTNTSKSFLILFLNLIRLFGEFLSLKNIFTVHDIFCLFKINKK